MDRVASCQLCPGPCYASLSNIFLWTPTGDRNHGPWVIGAQWGGSLGSPWMPSPSLECLFLVSGLSLSATNSVVQTPVQDALPFSHSRRYLGAPVEPSSVSHIWWRIISWQTEGYCHPLPWGTCTDRLFLRYILCLANCLEEFNRTESREPIGIRSLTCWFLLANLTKPKKIGIWYVSPTSNKLPVIGVRRLMGYASCPVKMHSQPALSQVAHGAWPMEHVSTNIGKTQVNTRQFSKSYFQMLGYG